MMAFGIVMYKGTGEDKSDKNKYADKSWRLNFTCGYSLSFMPVYMNSVSTVFNGSTFYDAEKKQVGTANLDLGFQYSTLTVNPTVPNRIASSGAVK